MSQLEKTAGEKWAAFRGFIRRHPLTGFWIGVAGGATIVGGAWRLFG